METETLIIGGGLAGLALAGELSRTGKDFLLIEARDRLGGRVLSETYRGVGFDMGPTWFWPGQPRIADLVERFGLERFEQFALGDVVYEDQSGVQRGRGFASMEGSYRLSGGLGALVDALRASLPDDRVVRNTGIKRLEWLKNRVEARSPDQSISAQRVVLALPPRIAAEFAFEPDLPDSATNILQSVPTWMAGQAKVVAIFERPFWREAGLSGDAMSRIGPMVEIHDASPKAGGPYALFGFIGVSPNARADEDDLREQLIAQFGRLFGDDAKAPVKIMLKDWAYDPHTSTPADLAPLSEHPQYRLPKSLTDLWDGRLLFAGSEVAPSFGGYLEGALEAAEIAYARLKV